MTATKCTKKRDARAGLFFCQSKPIAFLLPFSLASPSSLLTALLNKQVNSKVQKPPSQLRFSLPSIIITITSNEPLIHGNTQNGSKSTNHKSQIMTFWTRLSKVLFPKRSAKMIDDGEKHNRQLAFFEKRSKPPHVEATGSSTLTRLTKNHIDWNKRATAISHHWWIELNQIGYYDRWLEELLRFFSMYYRLNKIWNWIVGEFVLSSKSSKNKKFSEAKQIIQEQRCSMSHYFLLMTCPLYSVSNKFIIWSKS